MIVLLTLLLGRASSPARTPRSPSGALYPGVRASINRVTGDVTSPPQIFTLFDADALFDADLTFEGTP